MTIKDLNLELLAEVLDVKLKDNALYGRYKATLNLMPSRTDDTFSLSDYLKVTYYRDISSWILYPPYSGVTGVINNIGPELNEFEYLEALCSIHELARDSIKELFPDYRATFSLTSVKSEQLAFLLKEALREKTNYPAYVTTKGDIAIGEAPLYIRLRESETVSKFETDSEKEITVHFSSISLSSESLANILEEQKLVERINAQFLKNIYTSSFEQKAEDFKTIFNNRILEHIFYEEELNVDFYSRFKEANPDGDLKEIYHLSSGLGRDQDHNLCLKTLHGYYIVKNDLNVEFRNFNNLSEEEYKY